VTLDIEEIHRRWTESSPRHPVVRRLLPWAESLLDAARISTTCGLQPQARRLAARVQARLEELERVPVADAAVKPIDSRWDARELPAFPDDARRKKLSRRVRSLRSHRMPFSGQGHPKARGLAWGPYNQQSALAEALSAIAGADPLWVDDLLERERTLRSIDRLLGLPG
jgi:hypothetical protein